MRSPIKLKIFMEDVTEMLYDAVNSVTSFIEPKKLKLPEKWRLHDENFIVSCRF